MSGYPGSGANYPLPHSSIHGPSASDNDGPPHHGLPNLNHGYQYDAPPPQQQQQQQLHSPYGNGHQNGHPDGQQLGQQLGQQQLVQQQQQQPQSAPVTPSNGNGTDGQKGNRLRKACDSCSIRKVRVSANEDAVHRSMAMVCRC